jgi:hypothetical protein
MKRIKYKETKKNNNKKLKPEAERERGKGEAPVTGASGLITKPRFLSPAMPIP